MFHSLQTPRRLNSTAVLPLDKKGTKAKSKELEGSPSRAFVCCSNTLSAPFLTKGDVS